MKKIFFVFLITFITFSSFAQQLYNLNIEEWFYYRHNKPFCFQCNSFTVSDENGRIVKKAFTDSDYVWFDWNKGVIKSIEYNNLHHPCGYREINFNNSGLITKNIYKSLKENYSYEIIYSKDFSNFTIYKNDGVKKIKDTYGEYVIENNSYVYYESNYEDENVVSAYKMIGPNLSGDLRNNSFNCKEDNPIYLYTYRDNNLSEIQTIYGTEFDAYFITYRKDKTTDSIHIIKNKNKDFVNESVFDSDYKIVYEYDEFDNPITSIRYLLNKDFEIEYLEPLSLTEYTFFYKSNKEKIEPPIPSIFYDKYELTEELLKTTNKSEKEVPAKSEKPIVSNLWEKAYYVDSFGDYTSVSYIRPKEFIQGTFSNWITKDSKLLVAFLIDNPNSMAIKLYEYGYSEVRNMYSTKSSDYDIYVKDEAGNSYSFTGKNTDDRVEINPSDCVKIHKLMLANDTLKFHMTYDKSNTYNFTLKIDQSYRDFFKD